MPRDSITSLHNPLVKACAKLRRRGEREAQGKFLIDGARELTLALAGGVRVETVFTCQPLCHTEASRRLLARLAPGAAPADKGLGPVPRVVEVAPAVFRKLAYGERAEGVLGVACTPRAELSRLNLPQGALVAVVEGLEKPGNLGAILRCADAAGVSALVAVDCRTDLYNPNAIRASLGTIFSVPVCAAAAAEALAWLRGQHVRIYAARADAATPYTRADFRPAAALVLGSEAAGLSAVWSAADITPLRIPMRGAADSLNVSAAAAVLFYEALRQRTL